MLLPRPTHPQMAWHAGSPSGEADGVYSIVTDPQSRPPAPLTATFLTSADRLDRCPADDAPEVCFVGRSNAGKSSTLNRLTGSKSLARVSKTPGRTQLINFFALAGGGRLVDLPGYGYAKAPKARRKAWGRAIDDYLNGRANLAGIVLVMDARRPLQPFDEYMVEWCQARGMPMLALLNKADKLKRGARVQALRHVERELTGHGQAVLFSALTGLGTGEAIAVVRSWLPVAGATQDAATP